MSNRARFNSGGSGKATIMATVQVSRPDRGTRFHNTAVKTATMTAPARAPASTPL